MPSKTRRKSANTATFVAVEKPKNAARRGQLGAEIKEVGGMVSILEKQIKKWGKTMDENRPDDGTDPFSEYQIASRKRDHCLYMVNKQKGILMKKNASLAMLSFSYAGGSATKKRRVVFKP